jgi:hypothetical protein
MNDEPAVGRIEVLVRSKVLHEQHGAYRTIEQCPIEQRTLRDSNLSKDTCNLRRVDPNVAAYERNTGRRPEANDAVTSDRGVSKSSAADQRTFLIRDQTKRSDPAFEED